MTLEETIAHHRWCADNCDGEVRDEQLQMVAWLDELVKLRNENDNLKNLLKDALEKKFSDEDHLKAENAKLREQVTRLQADWESERDYADQMEAKEKKAVAENNMLRELVVRMRPICVEGKRCTFADRIHINSSMEELRIEVG